MTKNWLYVLIVLLISIAYSAGLAFIYRSPEALATGVVFVAIGVGVFLREASGKMKKN